MATFSSMVSKISGAMIYYKQLFYIDFYITVLVHILVRTNRLVGKVVGLIDPKIFGPGMTLSPGLNVTGTTYGDVLNQTFTSFLLKGDNYGTVLYNITARSRLECCLHCASDVRCLSLTFNRTSKRCITNEQVLRDLLITCPACLSPEKVTYAYKTLTPLPTPTVTTSVPTCSKSIGDACATQNETSTCVDLHSHCHGNVCRCHSGHSWDNSSCQCVTECAHYGTTFQLEMDAYIDISLVFYNDVTLETCFEKCLTEVQFTCRSIDYKENGQYCYVHNNTALHRPDKIVYSSAFDIYTRDCA